MNSQERRLHNHKEKLNSRQKAYKERQMKSGFKLLQVRISRFVHSKASKIVATSETDLTRLYQSAIMKVDEKKLPTKPLEPIHGDLIGSLQIAVWITTDAKNRFDAMAGYYKTTTDAMSAIVNWYCETTEA